MVVTLTQFWMKKLERAVAAVLKKCEADSVNNKSLTFADVDDEVDGVDNNASSVILQRKKKTKV